MLAAGDLLIESGPAQSGEYNYLFSKGPLNSKIIQLWNHSYAITPNVYPIKVHMFEYKYGITYKSLPLPSSLTFVFLVKVLFYKTEIREP